MSMLYDWLRAAAKAQGNAKALVYRDNYLSWRGLMHRVDRRAQELRSMGIREGAWVGLMLGNVPDFIILALAVSKVGAACVPIDPTTGTRELELLLAAAPLRALVTRPRGTEGNIAANPVAAPFSVSPKARTSGQPGPSAGEEVPEIRRRLQGTLLTCSVFKRPDPSFAVKPIVVLFTTDSLGDPKGVLRTQDNVASVTDNVVEALSIVADSRILVAVPLHHAYGWDVGLLPVLRTGATMFLEEEIASRRLAKVLRDHNIDVVPGTPGMYNELARLPLAKPLTSERPRFLSAGSKLEPSVAESFTEKYGVRIMSCYHSTETGVVAIDRTTKRPKSVGKPIDGIEVKLATARGGRVAAGKQGLVWVRGNSLSPRSIGPYSEIDAKAEKKNGEVPIGACDQDGWFRVGDKGRFDRSGCLYLLGREDNLVKVDGKRVALGEVEGCLESFPKVKEAQARVVTDPMTGSMVVARVVAKTEFDPAEIIDHCARNLAPYKVPRRIEFCDDI